MTNSKRPKNLSLIAWILIVGSLYYFAGAIVEPEYRRSFVNMLKSDSMSSVAASKVLALLWLIISGIIGVVSGIAILKGLNWGRLLCLYYMPISIISYNILLIAGFGFLKIVYLIVFNTVAIAFYIVIIIFLTRQASLAFFAYRSSEKTQS